MSITIDLTSKIAAALEREHRHLSDEPSEGHMFDGVELVELPARQLRRTKKSYNARFFNQLMRERNFEGFQLKRGNGVEPKSGDLLLARLVTIGHHRRLESQNSRRRHLFVGDEIVVAYGDRYAPDQFLAELPRNLNYTNLVAAGGLAGRVIEKHAAINPATVIEPLGLICDDDGVINLKDVAPERVRPWREAQADFAAREKKPLVVVVFGSSMNSGKSTTLGCLVNGLDAAGLVVNAGKATGTGAGNDAGLFNDAGANAVRDFTDFGLPSTFKLSLDDVKDVLFSMVESLAGIDAPDVITIEIADGIYQGETAGLVHDDDFRELVDKVVFSCGEALSAAAGVSLLREANLPLVAVSGLLTSSPLITAEARDVVDVDIIPTYDLCIPEVAQQALQI